MIDPRQCSKFAGRWRSVNVAVCGGLLLGGILLSSVPVVNAQDAPSIEQRLSDPVYMTWVSEPAVAACIQCHFDGPGLAEIASGQSGQLNAFSRRQEMDAWVSQDKHTIARRRVEPLAEKDLETDLLDLYDRMQTRTDEVVAAYRRKGIRLDANQIGLTEVPKEWIGTSNVLSRRICDKLWGEGAVESPEGYAQFREACLTCHGGVTGEETRGEGVLTKNAIGIDCLYCHQEGTQVAWQKKHFDSDSWRLSSPEAKRSSGMTDLVNTANQASLCLDCHVGNRERGMFVTHQMYAAGHPPLPSVEVQTFCEQMPQHWQSPSTLYENLGEDSSREPYFEINYPGVVGRDAELAGKTHWDTRKVFIGALVARRKAVQLMVQLAQTDDWGDYALYDCAACHHELQTESRRQQRYLTSSQPSTPGRPRQHEWQNVLLDVAYRLGGKVSYEKIERLERALERSFDEQPLGAADSVSQVGSQLIDEIDKLIDVVQTRAFNESLTRVALKVIAETDGSRLLTYDAARQAVWAVDVMTQELQRVNGSVSDSVKATVSQLHETELTGLDTDLPSGRKQFIYPDYLGVELKRRAQFNPDALVDLLHRLGNE
ncbi:cytochrome c family protein [Aporhodopirellula aestuarii]|uniref:Cytochrome c family protein n=1 Tax=Aporhodopirellula aestuarii TaxID=2950107 RepID=A0ABT0UEC5_9BACT|nr:cytochrome c family protein [Aporhodopirellula aestuarii]MCM2374621.1 cytochrome c family protein [Aporhodopirellula aestuarii]